MTLNRITSRKTLETYNPAQLATLSVGTLKLSIISGWTVSAASSQKRIDSIPDTERQKSLQLFQISAYAPPKVLGICPIVNGECAGRGYLVPRIDIMLEQKN